MARKRKKKQELVRESIQSSLNIECRFRPLTEFGSALPDWNPNLYRYGRYSCSKWGNISKRNYLVLAYIEGDFQPYLDQGIDPGEVAAGCVNFLNIPPKRKKFAKRTPKPLYGNLNLFRYKLREGIDGKCYFEVMLTTDKKKNKLFWGSGLTR